MSKNLQVDQLTLNGHHAQSVIAAASLLEELLRNLYSQIQPHLSPAEHQAPQCLRCGTYYAQKKPLTLTAPLGLLET